MRFVIDLSPDRAERGLSTRFGQMNNFRKILGHTRHSQRRDRRECRKIQNERGMIERQCLLAFLYDRGDDQGHGQEGRRPCCTDNVS